MEWKLSNWVTRRDLILFPLKSQNLYPYLYEDEIAPEIEQLDEEKETVLIKKNISPEVYYHVRNLTRQGEKLECGLPTSQLEKQKKHLNFQENTHDENFRNVLIWHTSISSEKDSRSRCITKSGNCCWWKWNAWSNPGRITQRLYWYFVFVINAGKFRLSSFYC